MKKELQLQKNYIFELLNKKKKNNAYNICEFLAFKSKYFFLKSQHYYK